MDALGLGAILALVLLLVLGLGMAIGIKIGIKIASTRPTTTTPTTTILMRTNHPAHRTRSCAGGHVEVRASGFIGSIESELLFNITAAGAVDREFFSEHFRQLKLNRFAEFNLSNLVLSRCRCWSPKIRSSIAADMCSRMQVQGPRPVRIVLPFNYEIYNGAKEIVSEIQSVFDILATQHGWYGSLSVSWRNSAMPLHLVLRRRQF